VNRVQLQIIGHTAPFPAPGLACPGYLVTEGNTRILIDGGCGVLERLMAVWACEELTAVLVSHFHFDHCSDLYVLRYALDALRRQGRRMEVLPIYSPPEPPELAGLLTYREATRRVPVTPGETANLGEMRVRFVAAEHTLPALGMVLKGATGTLAYSADCRWGDAVVAVAQGADLFLCEATFQDGEEDAAGATGHLTARQAAMAADRARAGRLLLTHIPAAADRQVSLEQAQADVDLPVALAEAGRTYDV
jgi:ribonuclease BN (tRNA processing enzyme)